MRNVKFRGLDYKTKEWVYGMLYYSSSQTGFQIVETIDCPPSMQDPCGDTINRYYNVEPKQIGQYIGLNDKNDNEIYEGDIIKYYQPYAKRWDVRKVIFDTQFACFGTALKDQHTFDECDWVKIENIEVIGNIHENPELLD